MILTEVSRQARRTVLALWSCSILAGFTALAQVYGSNVTLAWNPSPDAAVTGYHLYFGAASSAYTNMVDVGNATSITISNLVQGTTYYFAATTYTSSGLESDYSSEVSYTVPPYTVPSPNQAPTLDAMSNVVINENAGLQTVNLTGISSGASNQVQTLTVTANSSNPALVPNPTVSYVSPNPTGTLTFAPATNAFGVAQITVTVDDGQPTNNTITRSFALTVNQPAVVATSTPLTNAIIAPHTAFRFLLSSPYANNDSLTYSLGAGAPAGAKIATKQGASYVTWRPDNDQAGTTNLITIIVTDNTDPTLSTNETVLVTVLDVVALTVGSTSVQAGQSAMLPIYLSSSSGVTNLSFSLDWPSDRFLNPSLFIAVPGVANSAVQTQSTAPLAIPAQAQSPTLLAGSIQVQGPSLLLSLQTEAGQVLQDSNLIAQLSFQTVSSQSSAFVNLAVRNLSASKPDSSPYVNYVPVAGQVAVISTKPLLAADLDSNSNRTLTAFGKIGATYLVQYSTNLAVPDAWIPLSSYTQTNLSQSLPVDPNNPFIFYRLLAP